MVKRSRSRLSWKHLSFVNIWSYILLYLIYVEKDISPIMVISHLLAHYTWFMDSPQHCYHHQKKRWNETDSCPKGQQVFKTYLNFRARIQSLKGLSLVFSFKNHKNPRSTKVFDTAIHPNGVLRGASDNGTGGFQLLEVQMVLSLVSSFLSFSLCG